MRKRKALRCDAYIGSTDQCHHQRRQESYIEVLSAADKIHRNSPKRKHRECLIAPCKISPDYLESFCITQAVNQDSDSKEENRDTDQQTFADRALVDM